MELTRKLVLLLTALGCMPVLSQETARVLPVTDGMPRTRAEWDAENARRNALPGSSFKEALPEYAPQFDAMMERMRTLVDRYHSDELVYDSTLAEQLIAELYVDAGHPTLNAVSQDYIVDPVIREVAAWDEERLPPAARRVLADGLLAYAQAGGGQYTPASRAYLAATLDRLEPDDPAVRQTVEAMFDDALAWANTVGSDVEIRSVSRQAERHWGDAFWLRAYETESRDTPLPAKRPERFDKATAALAALLAEPGGDRSRLAARLREATTAALADFKDPALNNDVTCRLLIVYRRLLARRPMIAPRLSDYIENRLLWLAVKSDRLTTERHWSLWADAVIELRADRASDRFKSYIRAMLKTKDLPAVRCPAAERLRSFAAE
jgi:hypothetical protein